jgi:glycosyltransferase involved in cell wall biosynthesis
MIRDYPRPAADAAARTPPVILFLHNRYRSTGGEERAVEDLLWLVREHLHEDAELLGRDSGSLRRIAGAAAMLGGGLRPEEVARAVRRTKARIVHTHNLNPTFGWRALAAAREAGARVVAHLHQYRLVCAVGVCFTDGEDCTRCHGRNTVPGVLHNCRGRRGEAVVYAAALSLWQRRVTAQVDAFIVPSRFAAARLRALGAPVGEPYVVPHAIRATPHAIGATPPAPASRANGGHALFAGRLSAEKGIDTAIEACRLAGIRLVLAGDGPERERIARTQPGVQLPGRVGDADLARLRRDAAVALAPSRSAETFGLAAAEAMAAGLPVAASRIGALPELVPDEWLAPPGDAAALAATIRRLLADPGAGARALEQVRAVAAPEVVAPALAAVYDG